MIFLVEDKCGKGPSIYACANMSKNGSTSEKIKDKCVVMQTKTTNPWLVRRIGNDLKYLCWLMFMEHDKDNFILLYLS